MIGQHGGSHLLVWYGDGFKDDPTPGVGEETGLAPGLQPVLGRLQSGTMGP